MGKIDSQTFTSMASGHKAQMYETKQWRIRLLYIYLALYRAQHMGAF